MAEDGALVRIEATIVVERENQKGILIGKGGAMLKAIGTEARQDIEAFLGTKVYLGLFVKVRENWRENASVLHEIQGGSTRLLALVEQGAGRILELDVRETQIES